MSDWRPSAEGAIRKELLAWDASHAPVAHGSRFVKASGAARRPRQPRGHGGEQATSPRLPAVRGASRRPVDEASELSVAEFVAEPQAHMRPQPRYGSGPMPGGPAMGELIELVLEMRGKLRQQQHQLQALTHEVHLLRSEAAWQVPQPPQQGQPGQQASRQQPPQQLSQPQQASPRIPPQQPAQQPQSESQPLRPALEPQQVPHPPPSDERGRPSPAKRPTRAAATAPPTAEADAQLDEPANMKTAAETAVDVPPVVEQTELAQEVDAGKDEEEPYVALAEPEQVDDAGAASGEEMLASVAAVDTAGAMQVEIDKLVTVVAEVTDAGVVIRLNISDLVSGA